MLPSPSPSLPRRQVSSSPSQSLLLTWLFHGDVSSSSFFGAWGRLPSVVYISVAPSGMSTTTLSVPGKSWLPWLTTGGASRSVA